MMGGMMKRWVAFLAGLVVVLPMATGPVLAQGEMRLEARRVPVARRPKPDLIEAQKKLRMHRAEVIQELGFEVDWTRHTASDLLDMELRIRKAQELKKLGYDAIWETDTLAELIDKETRLEKARSLAAKGVLVNWVKTSLKEMTDMENRIHKAERLHRLGVTVNWQKLSLKELSALEAAVLNRLAGR